MFRLSSKKALCQELKCKIKLLIPDEEVEIGYNINSIGQDVMNELVQQLDLLDKDYYGLKLYDQIQWLDLNKSISKQVKGLDNIIFELRFKYYPAEPAMLANESTRYNLYLQLKLDLIEGRLRSESKDTIAYLIACILQSELGDYTPNMNNENENYVSEFKFVPNQTDDLEWAAIDLHQGEDFLGLQPSESELNFLKKASQLDTYGVDPYPVKEGNSHNHFLIGVNHKGISTFQDSKKTNQFTWDEIDRITLDNKLVLIYCRRVDKKGSKPNKLSKTLFGFRCPSVNYAQNFWKIACEHRFFFTLESTPDLPIVANTGGLFKKSHKLRYSGRVEKDVLKDHVDDQKSVLVKRSHSLMSKSNDGPRWQGFQQGSNLQNSLSNIYQSDFINKTMPSDLNYLREEEEDQLEDCDSLPLHQTGGRQGGGVPMFADSKKRNSSGSLARDSPRTFTRRSVMTKKSEMHGHTAWSGSQVYMDTAQRNHDFVKTSIILALVLVFFSFLMLSLNVSDRPNYLVKKLNLVPVSNMLRDNYYLPFKSRLRELFSHISTFLELKLS